MNNENFEILAHISDFRLKVWGKDLKNLFSSALQGMNSVLKNNYHELNRNEITEKLNIVSIDTSMLLIDFLSEMLTLSHSRKAIFNYVDFFHINETTLGAEIKGESVNEFDEDIKAVTYTENYITINKEGFYESLIVFDI